MIQYSADGLTESFEKQRARRHPKVWNESKSINSIGPLKNTVIKSIVVIHLDTLN